MYYNRPLGILLVTLGMIFFFVVVGTLILRILLAFAALSLINYGMRMQQQPPLIFVFRSWYDRYRW